MIQQNSEFSPFHELAEVAMRESVVKVHPDHGILVEEHGLTNAGSNTVRLPAILECTSMPLNYCQKLKVSLEKQLIA